MMRNRLIHILIAGMLICMTALSFEAFAGEKSVPDEGDEAKDKPAVIKPCKVFVLPYSGEAKSEIATAVGKFLDKRSFTVLDAEALKEILEDDDYGLVDLLDRSEGACEIAVKAGAVYVVAADEARHESGKKVMAILITLSDGSSSNIVEVIAAFSKDESKSLIRAIHETCHKLNLVSDPAEAVKLPPKGPDMTRISKLKKKRIEDNDFEPAGSGIDLVKNGGFEKLNEKGHPAGWEELDGLTQFIVDRPDGGGKCLMFDTDVDQKFVEAWRRRKKANPRAKPPTGDEIKRHAPDKPGYNTIGGLEGVLNLCDPIPVEKGACYRFTVDVMSDETKAMLFIKGYGYLKDKDGSKRTDRPRQMYLGQKHGDEHVKKEKAAMWNTYSHVFFPTWRTPDVEFIRIELYGYWKPGKVYFDNVRFEKVEPLSPELHPEKRGDEVSKSYKKKKEGEEEKEKKKEKDEGEPEPRLDKNNKDDKVKEKDELK